MAKKSWAKLSESRRKKIKWWWPAVLAISIVALTLFFLDVNPFNKTDKLEPTRFEEPAKVFAWKIRDNVIDAQLIDHVNQKQIKSASIRTNLPIAETDPYKEIIQYHGPTDTIFFIVTNRVYHPYAETRVPSPDLGFCNAIYATDFQGSKPRLIWSEKECALATWVLHPQKPEMYVTAAESINSSRGTLYVVDLEKGEVVKSIGRNLSSYKMALNPDTGELASAQWLGNMHFRGTKRSFIEIAKSNPHSDEGYNPIFIDESFENFQYLDDIENFSPHFKFFPYEFGFIDVQTGENFPIDKLKNEDLVHTIIWWSADESQILFFTKSGLNVYHRAYHSVRQIPLIKDLGGPHQWAPSQRYLLFSSYSEDVQVWDNETRKYIKLTEGFKPDGAAWAY